jgi:hypothetical protein
MLVDLVRATPPRVGKVRFVLAGLTLAIAVWLGYALGRGQSLADVARLYRDGSVLQYTVETGDLTAQFARTGGALKPLLKTPDGTALLDYTDWDYNAGIVVDGRQYDFVRLIPTDTADYARNRIVAGLSAGDWVLSREITLHGAQAEITFTFLANTPIHEVWLHVPHTNWYFLHVSPSELGFSATVARATRGEIEQGLVRAPAYEVTVSSAPAGEAIPKFVRLGTATPYGIQSVTTEYVLRDPPMGQYVPVATEQVTWRRL